NQRREAVVLSVSPEIFDRNVAAFLVAGVTQALAKRVKEIGFQRRGRVAHVADKGRFLLRARGDRPGGGRSTPQGKELPPSPYTPQDSVPLLQPRPVRPHLRRVCRFRFVATQNRWVW